MTRPDRLGLSGSLLAPHSGSAAGPVANGAPTSRFSFPRLIVGILLLNASGGVLFAVLPLLEIREGGGPLLATLISGAPLAAQVLATFVWGALSDRWGRRRELLAGGVLGQSVLFLTYPFLDPITLLLVRILQVFLGATSVLANTVATEDRARPAGHGLGDLSFWGGIGGVLGVLAGLPFLGGSGLAAHSAAADGLFVLLALLSGASVLFLALTGEIARPKATTPLKRAFHFESGPWVVRLSLATAVVGVANYLVFTTFPLFIHDVLAANGPVVFGTLTNPTQQLALLSIGAGMGGVVVSRITGRWVEGERRRRRLYLVAPAIYALLWAGFALVRSFDVVFLIWSFPASIFFTLPLTREVSALTPRHERGRAVGILGAAYTLGGLGGAFLGGIAVGADLPFRSMYLAAAGIDLLGMVILYAVVRGRGGLPSGEPPSLVVSGSAAR